MLSYRIPSARSVAQAVWEACKAFLRKVGRIILVTTIVLWLLLNLPGHGLGEMQAAGVDTADDVAVSSYVIDNCYGADAGRLVASVFEPLGSVWRINVSLLASLSDREVFVATLGQVASAQDVDNPSDALQKMTVAEGPRAGGSLFTAPVLAALLVFFLYALQCMATVGVMRRESGTWRWPGIAFTSMFVLAGGMAFPAKTVVEAVT